MTSVQLNAASYQKRRGESTAPTAAVLGQIVRGVIRAHPEISTWLFSGPLGAGKSTAVRAVLRGLGIKKRVPSPTFTLVQSYALPRGGKLYHLDAYRVRGPHEWGGLGLDEIVGAPQSLVCVEWPERLRGFRWGAHGHIRISMLRRGRRCRWVVSD